MAQGHKHVSLNVTNCEFQFPEVKYLILSFLCSGKFGVEFPLPQSTVMSPEIGKRECLNW